MYLSGTPCLHLTNPSLPQPNLTNTKSNTDEGAIIQWSCVGFRGQVNYDTIQRSGFCRCILMDEMTAPHIYHPIKSGTSKSMFYLHGRVMPKLYEQYTQPVGYTGYSRSSDESHDNGRAGERGPTIYKKV